MSTAAIDTEHLSPRAGQTWKIEILIAVLAAGVAAALTQGTVLVIITALATFVLAVLRVDAAFFVFVFFLPLAPVVVTGLPIHDVSSLLKIVLFAGIFLGYISSKKTSRGRFLGPRLNWLVIGYGLVAFVSVFAFHGANPNSLHALFRLLSYLSFFFAVIAWVKNQAQMKVAINVLLLSTVVVSLFGIYQAVINDYSDLYFRLYPLVEQEAGIEPWIGRVPSFLFHFNALAGYLNLVLPFALALTVMSPSGALRRLAGTCFALGSLTLVLTQSRGGLVAYGAVVLVAVLYLAKSRKTRFWLLALFPIAAVIAVPIIALYSERAAHFDELTAVSRLVLFGAAFSMFLSSPIIGVGYGNFRELSATMIPGTTVLIDSHNLYLQLLSETGIVGLGAFLVIMVGMMRLALRQFRCPRTPFDQVIGFGAFAAIVSVLVHGLVDFLFIGSPQFGALFWLVLGLLVANELLRTSSAGASPA
jgi:O-antigen ligase